ncbi:integrase, catalytic region, zinc finger, CCHC-type containing protein [Tanacetum coccineum]|uniref:Integrase, catalytic region, zinc finger, CCHC-type containing protein n=1 Tax=Tanacetum coccineum TaxID=301880 RepID=A0ABQ5IE35_9ASTR
MSPSRGFITSKASITIYSLLVNFVMREFEGKLPSTQTWLWHHRLSHLNFDTINMLFKNDIVNSLTQLKYVKDQLCSSCEMSKVKRSNFKTKTAPSSKGRSKLVTNVVPLADKSNPSLQDFELLFSPMYEEYFNEGNQGTNHSNNKFNAEDNNSDQAVDAQFDADEFINPLCTLVHEVAESFSHNIDTSNMHRFCQRHRSDYHWTRDHPLEQVCGNPSDTDEAKDIKEAMVDHAWIEAMQEELNQFDRLSVLEIWCLGSGNGGVSVVVRGGDMVVSGGLKGCLDNRILRSSLILPPILLDLGIVYVRCVGV